MPEITLKTPLSEKVVRSLKIGDKVLISGILFTARDAAHKRLLELIKNGKELPFDPNGQIIYYVGPTPAQPGSVIGSAGPTTSARIDPYLEALLKLGLKGSMGKGPRAAKVKENLKKYRAVYFAATGGAGALLSKKIKKANVIAFEDLGPEAIYKLDVEKFPAIVAYDSNGGDLFEEGVKKYKKT
jgi:fumarate hydratase subunit beta